MYNNNDYDRIRETTWDCPDKAGHMVAYQGKVYGESKKAVKLDPDVHLEQSYKSSLICIVPLTLFFACSLVVVLALNR